MEIIFFYYLIVLLLLHYHAYSFLVLRVNCLNSVNSLNWYFQMVWFQISNISLIDMLVHYRIVYLKPVYVPNCKNNYTQTLWFSKVSKVL